MKTFLPSLKSFLIELFISKHRDRTFYKSIIFTGVSILLCTSFISDGVFVTADDTRILFLMIISLCVWSGLFNSISDIAKIKDNLIEDSRRGLSMLGFILAEAIIQFIICLVETIIVWLVVYMKYDFPNIKLVFDISYMDYVVTIFLIFLAADYLGIVFSTLSVLISNRNPFSFTMTILPLILLIQLLLSDMLIKLKGDVATIISHFSICKWGVLSMERIIDINKYPRAISLAFPDYQFAFPDLFSNAYQNDLIYYWLILILFIIISIVLAYIFLKLRNKFIG